MSVIREGGKLTSNDKTWSYHLPHLHVCVVREGEWGQGEGRKAWFNNLLLLPSTGFNLNKPLSPKPCYWGPDFSGNKEWYYLKIAHTREHRQGTCVLLGGKEVAQPVPMPSQGSRLKAPLLIHQRGLRVTQDKTAFFLARQWRSKTLNPALLESISLAVTEKSINDRAKTA